MPVIKTTGIVATSVTDIPSNQLACRAGRHLWPSDALEFGKPLPKGLTAEATDRKRGVYQLIDECQRCGKVRRMDTAPNHVYDVNAWYAYRDPKDWVRCPETLDLKKRDMRAENFRRNAEELFQ